jgi:hypothetical protein
MRAGYYQIRVRGHLDRHWSEWFDNMTITHDADGATTLVGIIPDQSALYGLLNKARDLGLTLLAVARIEPQTHGACEAG